MTQSIIEIEELRKIAQQHAMAITTFEGSEDKSLELHAELTREFQLMHQPNLTNKQCGALFQTYHNMVVTAVSNYYTPGSRVENPPVQVSSISDDYEVYIPNSSKQAAEWDTYTSKVIAMAERFAREIALLVSQGGDTTSRMKEQQYEMAKFSIDHNLSTADSDKEAAIYEAAFLKALEKETIKMEAQSKSTNDDTEEQYRRHLSGLIERSKSRGNGRYFNQFLNKCRDEAAAAYPKGAAAAQINDRGGDGAPGILGAIFSFFGR